MSPVAEVFLVGLAAFWVFVLAARSKLAEPLRAPVERRADRAEDRMGTIFFTRRDRGWINAAYFITCGWCLGAWLALAVTAVASLAGWTATPWPLLWLASAAVVGLLAERSG